MVLSKTEHLYPVDLTLAGRQNAHATRGIAMLMSEAIALLESSKETGLKVFYNDGNGNKTTIKARKSFSQFWSGRGLWFPHLRATINGREIDFLEGGDPESMADLKAFFRENKPMYITRDKRMGGYLFGKRAYDSN
jgi:hypothetical protein